MNDRKIFFLPQWCMYTHQFMYLGCRMIEFYVFVVVVVEGLVRSNHNYDDLAFNRLWLHECTRVIGDRLVNNQDIDAFQAVLTDLSKKYFPGDQTTILQEPVIYTNFVGSSETGNFTNYQEVRIIKKKITPTVLLCRPDVSSKAAKLYFALLFNFFFII